jgi:probable HAF family extracellular repeat protein
MVAQEEQQQKAEHLQHYIVTDLGTLPGGTFSQATYRNNNGLVTGISTAADGSQHAVLWVGGQIVDIAKTGPEDRTVERLVSPQRARP